ncbi:MAG: adenine phosphoribosyltransferase [Verrucomicrobiales bacterium]
MSQSDFSSVDPTTVALLRAAMRDVPDFPKPGVVFKDITPLLRDHELWDRAMSALVLTVGDAKVDRVVGIDARGFIFAAVVADRLNAGFVPVRKRGKLPWRTIGVAYDLEYGSNHIEMHEDAIRPGDRVLLVDDVLATGGTAAAALYLVRQAGGVMVGASFLVELGFLGGRAKLPTDVRIESVIVY